jgi:hypothetical protein
MWSVPDGPNYTVLYRLLRCHGKIPLTNTFFISKKRTPAITFLDVSVMQNNESYSEVKLWF